MKKSEANLKADAEICSSRTGSEGNSSRSIFHVGEPAIYIAPKQSPDQNSFPEWSYVQSSKPNSLQAIYMGSKQPVSQVREFTTKFIRFQHFGITLLEGLIFCGFLMGSFKQPEFLKWVDIVANIICGIKLVIVHVYIFIHNKNVQQNQKNQDKVMYLNNLALSELLQIWSICSTFLICFFTHNKFALDLISTIRLARLFFPFLDFRPAYAAFNYGIVWHLLKVTACIIFTLVLVAITMQLFLYNIDNYFCLGTSWMEKTTEAHFGMQKPASCGVNLACKSETYFCNNLYAFISTKEESKIMGDWVRKWRGKDQIKDTFSEGMLGSLWTITSISGPSYLRYSMFMIQEILFPLFVLSWLIYVILPALGLAEVIRETGIHNFKRELRKKSPIFDTPTICYPMSTKQHDVEYSVQVEIINAQILSRTRVQKVLTVLFHLLSLTQILLIILFNLQFNYPNAKRDIGVALGVIFILWSFGLGLAFYQWLTDPNRMDNKVKTYTLIYQLLAYSLFAGDYVIKIVFGQYLFESWTQLTPFSHGVVSLRILFILYNNGFDAQLSYLAQKVMSNFSLNAFNMGLVAALPTVLGFASSYWLATGDIREQVKYIVFMFGRMLGVGIRGQGPQMEQGGTIIMLIGILVQICLMSSIVVGYSSIFHIDYSSTQINATVNNNESALNIEIPKYRRYLQALHQNEMYRNFKIVLLASYVCVSLIFKLENTGVNLFLFCADCFLLLEMISKLVAFGMAQTSKVSLMFTITTSILSIILYFLIGIINPVPLIFVHASRCFLLLSLVPSLSQAFQECIDAFTHPKLSIFKLLIASICLVLSAGCLISISIGSGTGYQSTTSDSGKLIDLIGHSVGFVFGLKWAEVGANPMVLLCLQIMHISVVLLFHCLFIFLFSTHFLHLRMSRSDPDQIVTRISSFAVSARKLLGSVSAYQYVKIVKVVILLISICLLGSLSGSMLDHDPIRTHAATANLILHLIEIMIYCMQNFTNCQQSTWIKMETILLGLSLPGTFMLIFPVVKFSGYIQLSVLIRIFLALSMLRILRLYPLLADRSVFLLSSQILRRAQNYLQLADILNIVVIWILVTIPFAAFQSSILTSNISAEMINLITGSSLSAINLYPSQLILKVIYTILAHFPLRILLISKIVVSFIPVEPKTIPLSIIQDSLCQVIEQMATPTESMNLILPLPELYRFCAKVERIFVDFKSDRKLKKCPRYGEIIDKLKRTQIPVLSMNDCEVNTYCALVYDIVHHFAEKHLCLSSRTKEEGDKDNTKKNRIKGLTKSHFTIWQYWCWRGIKNKIMVKLNKSKAAKSNPNAVVVI